MYSIIHMECAACKRRNYSTSKNKRTHSEKLVLKKYCRHCRKHSDHKETK